MSAEPVHPRDLPHIYNPSVFFEDHCVCGRERSHPIHDGGPMAPKKEPEPVPA